ncbi:MAG: NADH-quinone oxidoreductase subunit C [Chlamydiae bacterium]|nr:NADH-quinone oxidoreductase subunit C [Chlamydiota bacterium]MBI3276776.1 NADH-quinone oxidoreductase subunit C [Chlamydiota bacterium]
MDILGQLKSKFSEYVTDAHSQWGDQTVLIKKEGLLPLVSFLKDDSSLDFNFLMDLTAVDYLGRENLARFEVVYHFYSLQFNHRIRVKALVPEIDCAIDSVVSLYPGANWYEREVWDMFGIKFNGHPNLKRILMYEPFEGHPLRKDYPVNKRQPLMSGSAR